MSLGAGPNGLVLEEGAEVVLCSLCDLCGTGNIIVIIQFKYFCMKSKFIAESTHFYFGLELDWQHDIWARAF